MKQIRKKVAFLIITIATIGFTIPLSAIAQKKVRIVFSLPNLTEQPYVSQLQAAQVLSKAQGFNLLVQNGQDNSSKQLNDIAEAIAQGVDGIIITPNDVYGFVPVIDKAIAAGIPVVGVGRDIKGTKGLIPYIGVDYAAGGVEIAKYISEKFPNGANIFVMTGQLGNSGAFDLTNELIKTLEAANKYRILTQQTGNSTSEEGFKATQKFLSSFGSPPNVIVAANDDLALGARRALKQSDVPKEKVTLIGFDRSKDFDKVADGTLNATVSFLPNKATKTAFAALLNHVRTGAPLTSYELQPVVVDNFNLGSVKLADNFELPIVTPTPAPTPTATRSPIANDPRQVTVLYATNRVRKADAGTTAEVPRFSSERGQDLTFGSAVIRVPEHHQPGHVERPREKWFLYVIPAGKEAENLRDHFTLLNLRVLTKQDFLQFIRDSETSSALLFVHGFDTNFEDALFRLAQISFDTSYKGVPIAFSWPSKGEITAYNYDRESAQYSADALLEVLALLKTNAKVSQICIIAHSMGNQIVMNAIDKASRGAERPSLAEVVLAEPDVDWDYFMQSGHLLTDVAKGVTLYASSTDTALLASIKWNGETKPRAGFIYEGGPIVLPGIETIDVTALGPDIFSLTFNHDIAMTVRSVLGDIGRLMTGGTHPPNVRSNEIRGVPEGSSTPRYWQYPP